MFTRNPTKFSVDKIPSQVGKTILVTGGNTGIGFETCLQLAKKGANVYLGARSSEKAAEAIKKIKEQAPEAKVTFLKLDLQDLKQIVSAAKEFSKKEPHLDVLINNAGIMIPPFELSKDGIETQFATNHVGHFLLTRELLPKILASPQPRIVNLSSSAHFGAPAEGIMFDKINEKEAMNTMVRYGQSKLANLLFSRSLNKKYGDKIYVNTVHPGAVRTELVRNLQDTLGIWYYPLMPFLLLGQCAFLSPSQGALNSLYCATSPDIVEKNKKCCYFVPFAQEQESSDLAKNDELAEKLWKFTEDLLSKRDLKN